MKLHYLEGISSALVVGLGQILRGKSSKGVLLLLSFYFALPALVYLALLLDGYFFLYVLGFAIISGIILWIYSIGDALIKNPKS